MRCRAGQFHRHSPAELRHVPLEHGGPDSIKHELPVTPRFYQASARQLLQVVRDRCLSDREAAAQPAAPHFGLLGDMLQDLEPSRIGESFGNSLELLGVHYQLPE